ncbi:hypothetical protein D9M68_876210 [compost metagenome]
MLTAGLYLQYGLDLLLGHFVPLHGALDLRNLGRIHQQHALGQAVLAGLYQQG